MTESKHNPETLSVLMQSGMQLVPSSYATDVFTKFKIVKASPVKDKKRKNWKVAKV